MTDRTAPQSPDPMVWKRHTELEIACPLTGRYRLEILEVRQSYLDELRADVAQHPGRPGIEWAASTDYPCGQTAAEIYMDLHAWLLDIEAGMQAPPLTRDEQLDLQWRWDGFAVVRRTLAARSQQIGQEA